MYPFENTEEKAFMWKAVLSGFLSSSDTRSSYVLKFMNQKKLFIVNDYNFNFKNVFRVAHHHSIGCTFPQTNVIVFKAKLPDSSERNCG